MSQEVLDQNQYAYLDLLEKKLDSKQKTVCCRTGNTIVAAGAGSGKTQVLATRFAWLVMSQGIRASQILTLTFTKKAAGEMYERIYKTLSFFAENPKTPAVEKKRAQTALEEFSEAHIQTLDSYCNSVVKQAANRYGIRPDFSAGAGDALEDIKKLALPYVFSNRKRVCVQQYADAGRLEDFAYDILAKAVSEYTTLADPADYFSSKLEDQKAALIKNWNGLICASPDGERPENTTGLKTIISQIVPAYAMAQQVSPGTVFINSTLTLIDYLSSMTLLHAQDIDGIIAQIPMLEKARDILDTIRLPGGKIKPEVEDFKDYIRLLRQEFEVINSFCTYVGQLDDTRDLYEMFDDFTRVVNESKRQTGNLTFADISELALKILNEQEDIRLAEQAAYEKIMIDEFQDNNSKNRDLLMLLADGKEKLFFVGDEKQSIYKFRGADVSVFNNLKYELGPDAFLQMNYNYRSANELLAIFNHIFGDNNLIFDNTTTRDFEARYTVPAIQYDPAKQQEVPEAKLDEESRKLLSIKLFDPTDLDKEKFFNTKDQLAIHIAKEIVRIRTESESRHVVFPYSSFAVLDRGRTDRRYLIKWFNVFNIPYTLDMNTSIFSDGPINDIYNFIQLCVYPQDRISKAGYLASPFANLSEQSVEAVLAGEDPEQWTDENEKQKYRRAWDFYETQRILTLSRPLTKTLEVLWNDCGYRYETMLSYRKNLYAEQFDMLFELARQTDLNDKGIAWFADQLSQIKDKEISTFGDDVEINIDEITYPIEKGDAVNVMTIHKSKGLQFEYVFVYGITDVTKRSKDSQFYFDKENGLTIKPVDGSKNFFYLRQEQRAMQEELAEFRRLIYVAITRAELKVQIVGSWKEAQTDSDTREDSFHLIENMVRFYCAEGSTVKRPFAFYKIEPVAREEMKELLFDSNKSENEKTLLELARQLYQNEPSINYEWPESNRKTPSSLEKEYSARDAQDGDSGKSFDSPEDSLEVTAFTAADFGTLVHAFLEAQAKGIPCDKYMPEAKLLKNLPDSPEVMKQILDSCKSMCRSFAQSDLGKALEECKSAGRFYRAEWAFRMFLDGYIFTGSIDLIFENADGIYTIVDYKSDKEIDVEKYRGQQDCYRKAAAKLLKIPEDKISCYLYFLKHNTAQKL
ncbi:MAG: UvrD-helicase domain-containing protein [Treponema sp.]|nr:UvrD-helicase domain-containing protein [Treponema sp.]